MFDPASLPFVDRLRLDLLAAEAEIRPLIRRLHYDPAARWPHRTAPLSTRHGADITVSAHEARTLLRAAIPVPMTTRPRLEKHAQLVAALATFATELHGLSIPEAGDTAIAAGLDLVHALKHWITQMRWSAATATAGVSWPADVAITAVLRHRTSTNDPSLFSEPPAKKAPRRRKQPSTPPAQRTLLLPIGNRPASIEPPIGAKIGQPGARPVGPPPAPGATRQAQEAGRTPTSEAA